MHQLIPTSRLLLTIYFFFTIYTIPTNALAELKGYRHLQAELISKHSSASRSENINLAWRLVPEKDWYIYWRNPGDAGAAPKLNWKINNQPISPTISWPTPEIIPYGPLTNYGYSNEILLSTSIEIPEHASAKISITLDAEWLVCKEECIPGNDRFLLELPLTTKPRTDSSLNSKHTTLFERHKKRIPTIATDLKPILSSSKSEWKLLFNLTLLKDQSLRFIPYSSGFIKYAAKQVVTKSSDTTLLSITKASNLNKELKTVRGLLLVVEEESEKIIPWHDGSASKEISFALQ